MTVVSPTGERRGEAPAPVATTKRTRGLLRGGWGRTLGLTVAVLVLVAVCWASMVVGNFTITLSDIIGGFDGEPFTDEERVVRFVRFPRTVSGLFAGIALGIAGAVMQGLTRNPIAGPGLLGINAGAALAAVLAITLFGVTNASGFLWFAFGGAAIAAVFVYMLGSLGLGGATPVKLALAGAALTALLASFTSMITLTNRGTLNDFRFWSVGSLTRADDPALVAVAPFMAVGVVVAIFLTRSLNALALGEDLARTLGTRIRRDRALAAVAVVLLAAGATVIAGPLGFIGLVVPHLARMITGPDYRWVLAWTAVLSPTLLLAADTLGRVIVQPKQLEVGIITALAGAPFFLYLVRNRKVVGV